MLKLESSESFLFPETSLVFSMYIEMMINNKLTFQPTTTLLTVNKIWLLITVLLISFAAGVVVTNLIKIFQNFHEYHQFVLLCYRDK